MPTMVPDNSRDPNRHWATVSSGCCSERVSVNDDWDQTPLYQEVSDRFDYCVQICGDINLGDVTIDNTGVELRLDNVLAELQDDFENGFVETPYCTPAGLPIFLLMTKAEQGGAITWDFYTLGTTGDPQVYVGDREICVDTQEATFEVDAC